MRGSARIYDVRTAQFVLKLEKLSHIIGVRGSQDLRSPSPIMAPDERLVFLTTVKFALEKVETETVGVSLATPRKTYHYKIERSLNGAKSSCITTNEFDFIGR